MRTCTTIIPIGLGSCTLVQFNLMHWEVLITGTCRDLVCVDLTLAGDAHPHYYTWGMALFHLAPQSTEYLDSLPIKVICEEGKKVFCGFVSFFCPLA